MAAGSASTSQADLAGAGQADSDPAHPVPQFRWHPKARLVDAEGQTHRAGGPAASTIAETPPARALTAAFAEAALGRAFRIGGTGDAPAATAVPTFETLTSGSTGAPRRIRRTQASWIASFQVNARLFGIGPGSRCAILGHLVQSLALYGAIESLQLGAETHVLSGLRPDRQMAALALRRITTLYASPAQLRLFLDAATEPAPDLRTLLVGGSRLDPATRSALGRLFPKADIREFYGAAEASFITLSDAGTPEGSVGRAYPGVDIRIADASGRLVETGLVWLRSPYLFDGYAADPGHAVWRDGWLSVGEIGRLENGYLHLAGRADRMVTIADQNVFPEEIEAFLLDLPGVTRAAVIARRDRRRGHHFEAVVEGGDADAILSACRKALGPLRAPRKLHRIAEWPMLPSGKIDRTAIEQALA